MTTARIILTNKEGSTDILIPVQGTTLERLIEDVPKSLHYEVVDESDIPSDRQFRSAWKHDTSISPQKISVDKALARDISLNRVRVNRDALLKDLDIEYTIAQRTSADTTALDARRLKLLAATDALKALDVNTDGVISVEEAAGMFIPMELIK